MAQTPPYAKKKYSLDAVSWSPIAAPFACNSVVVRNASGSINLKLRTDSADADTEDQLPPGNQELIEAHMGPAYLLHGGRSQRYLSGALICYLQAASGTVDALVTFME